MGRRGPADTTLPANASAIARLLGCHATIINRNQYHRGPVARPLSCRETGPHPPHPTPFHPTPVHRYGCCGPWRCDDKGLHRLHATSPLTMPRHHTPLVLLSPPFPLPYLPPLGAAAAAHGAVRLRLLRPGRRRRPRHSHQEHASLRRTATGDGRQPRVRVSAAAAYLVRQGCAPQLCSPACTFFIA